MFQSHVIPVLVDIWMLIIVIQTVFRKPLRMIYLTGLCLLSLIHAIILKRMKHASSGELKIVCASHL